MYQYAFHVLRLIVRLIYFKLFVFRATYQYVR